MAQVVTAKEFVAEYGRLEHLLALLGFEPDEDGVIERVTRNDTVRETLHQFLADQRRGMLNGELTNEGNLRRVEAIRAGIGDCIRQATGRAKSADAGRIVESLPESARDELADALVLSENREYVRPRLMSVEEFQEILHDFAGNQTLARSKLIERLHDELLRRGIDMSPETIEERFRHRPAVRTMPYCVKKVLGELGDEYRTGLIPIEELVGETDADLWLEQAQERFRFRSQSAMHRALAEATGLSYDSIHKALSGRRKAKRIHVEVQECFAEWAARDQRGEEIGVDESLLGVPVEHLHEKMPELCRRFPTKEAAYRAIAELTGLRAGSIRRYFQADGQLKSAPPGVLRAAEELIRTEAPLPKRTREAPAPAARCRRSCRQAQKECPKRAAQPEPEPTHPRGLAARAQDALRQWRANEDDTEAEDHYKSIRRELLSRLQARKRGGK